jgi:ribosomal protein S18 acetylase RimI-like enzyme
MQHLEPQMTRTTPTIEGLSVREPAIAMQLHNLMQAAYKVEAQLLQDDDFPPLRRTLQKLSTAQSRFFGIRENGNLHAAIELVVLHADVYIDALVVAPTQFRKGLGSALMQHVLKRYPDKTFIVQTGKANVPAINLYHKAGFITESATTTPAGLQLVSLVKVPGNN